MPTGDGTDAKRGDAPPRVTAAVVVTVMGPALAFTVTAVDPLMVSLNLSQISQGLHIPASRIGFLGSAATLVIAAAVLAVGNLGDTYGLKRLLAYGLIADIVVGLVTALSPNYWFLLAMRFLDGLALAVLLGLSLALLKESVPPQIRPAAIGVFIAIETVLYGVSPLAGGWVVETFGWRWLFVVAPALALAALVLTASACAVTSGAPPRDVATGPARPSAREVSGPVGRSPAGRTGSGGLPLDADWTPQGLMAGRWQWRLLQRRVPDLKRRRWVMTTLLLRSSCGC